DLLRFLKNLQQFAHPHGSNGWQHIERDACFGRVHVEIVAWAASPSSIGRMTIPRLKRDLVFVRRGWCCWFGRCADLGATGLPIFASGLSRPGCSGTTT